MVSKEDSKTQLLLAEIKAANIQNVWKMKGCEEN